MRIRLIAGLGFMLTGALGSSSVLSQEVAQAPTIGLERAVHFLSAEGTETVLGPGIYRVEAKGEKQITLTAIDGKVTSTVEAEAGSHEQNLTALSSVAVKSDEDVAHIVLLMPDGKTLDAIGTFSGVRTRGPSMVPLPSNQLAGMMGMQLAQGGGGLPPVSGAPIPPPGQPVPGQLSPNLPTQPGLQKTPPPLVQSGPRVNPCTQILQAGGVRIELKAQATGPRSVTITWSGPPGVYDVTATGPGPAFHVSTTLAPPLKNPRMTQTLPGTVTHAQALPGTRYGYAIMGSLADGRKACGGAEATTPLELTAVPFTPALSVPLSGWVDLHTHPMSHLAFGGKVFHGGPDVGSLLPAVHVPKQGFDLDPRPVCLTDHRAANMNEALGIDSPTHGGLNQSRCGDENRRFLIGAMAGMLLGHLHEVGDRIGAPTFDHWPAWDDILHQKMWVDWIRRAHQGGLRVMVALSHNNRTLADAVVGNSCSTAPITCVTDDVKSSNLQIEEMKAFVRRHSDFMEVALTAADVQRIVSQQKMAVILGVEIDNIGNFNLLPEGALQPVMILMELKRLYDTGVRYIFPIHITDNTFGGTGFYNSDFNWATYRESMYPSHLAVTKSPGVGNFWSVTCALAGEEIGFQVKGFFDAEWGFAAGVRHTRLGISPDKYPPKSPDCTAGHRNTKGLTPFGRVAIKEMMRLGMIIDIDHMSHLSAEEALSIAEGIPNGGYPIVSGHNGIRDQNIEHSNSENQRTLAQLARIGCLNGMFGLGTDQGDALDWAVHYMQAFNAMGLPTDKCPNKSSLGPGRVAFGTDTGTLGKTPKPRNVDLYSKPGFPQSGSPKVGATVWDYNKDGVAHYGMFADFVKDVRTSPGNQDLVDNRLMRSADYFYRMWQKIEAQKNNVPATCIQKGGPCS